ncbi:response regulator transcription factor [Granulicella tundricola]|uniref:Two component transcriptional regulator, winged helix family n=1 Tax=Granulicella tundricola (strain ATCC BAA-1859 / DSM 23138 / MP5ACTX9) TaxID=1198114 RepID=E8WWX1_GRATM|nr:response regulator transcription factor [Granulicella tundricola]ADW68532.1 two component transcriptional regulator, winged helix family [Granulicella tundricola MP5ACTX9]
MRVLIVEDDAALGIFLQKGLKLEGHDVQLVGDGQAGLDHAMEHAPDLMVLDLSLPKKDGIQVLEEMHGHFGGTSVLVLTGRNQVSDRVKCLNLGADDCLLKPFSFSELNARCRALLRRRQHSADQTLRYAGVELNRIDRRVTRDGLSIELTGKEFALLEFLMQARGRTCSRSELLREVWQMSPDAGTNVVDVYVNYLRKKLGSTRSGIGADRVIETVRGEGYMMSMGTERRPPGAAVPDGLQGSLRGPGAGVFGLGLGARASA